MGDRELDECVFNIGFRHCHRRPLINSPHAALDEQVEVNRAGFVPIETEPERMLQVIEAEMRRAARIGPVQKRTMLSTLLHTNKFPAPLCAIGWRR